MHSSSFSSSSSSPVTYDSVPTEEEEEAQKQRQRQRQRQQQGKDDDDDDLEEVTRGGSGVVVVEMSSGKPSSSSSSSSSDGKPVMMLRKVPTKASSGEAPLLPSSQHHPPRDHQANQANYDHHEVSHPRSMDEFLQSCYDDSYSSSSFPFSYWWMMLSLGVANSSDASEILCLSYILSDAEFERTILNDSSWEAGWLAASVFWGMLVGGLIVGVMGDSYGRRPMLLGGLMCNSISGMISAFARTSWQLSSLRAISGLGIGATIPPLFTLVTELAPPDRRGLFVTLAASFWMVGSIYVAIMALIVWEYGKQQQHQQHQQQEDSLNGDGGGGDAWRYFAVLCALPSAVGALMISTFVPESPRFLAIQGYAEESLATVHELAIRKLGRRNYTHHDNVGAEAATTTTRNRTLWTMEELLYYYPACRRSTTQISLHRRRPTRRPGRGRGRYRDDDDDGNDTGGGFFAMFMTGMKQFGLSTSKLYTRQLRKTTWPLQMVWFSLCFGSYGIATWINKIFVMVHLENVYGNALLFAIANLPGNLLSGFLMDRTGRKMMLGVTSLTAAASLLLFAYFAQRIAMDEHRDDDNNDNNDSASSSSSLTVGVVAAACSFQAFVIASWNTIDCMTSELFPTAVRSTGVGVCGATGRIGAMVAQFVNGALLVDDNDGSPVRLLLIASLSLAVAAITPCLLPVGGEMSHRPLVDTVRASSSSSSSLTATTMPPNTTTRTTGNEEHIGNYRSEGEGDEADEGTSSGMDPLKP